MDHSKLFVYGVGAFSGMITLLFPLSVIKTKQMASPHVSPGFEGARDVAKQIWKTDGLRGFYRGYSTILTGAIPTRMIYLPTYELARTAVNKTLDGMQDSLELSHTVRSSFANGIGGATASLASASIAVPIDVVSSRLMVLEQGGAAPAAAAPASTPARSVGYPRGSAQIGEPVLASAARTGGAAAPLAAKGAPGPGSVRGLAASAASHGSFNGWSMTRHIVRTEGVAGLYRGFGMSIITYTPSSALWWATYSVYQDLAWGGLYRAGVSVRNNDALSITGVQMLCGLLAGVTASIITCASS